MIQGSLLAMDHMGKHKGGKGGILVNISSVVGTAILPIIPVYCASKFNVLAFSRCLQVNSTLIDRKNIHSIKYYPITPLRHDFITRWKILIVYTNLKNRTIYIIRYSLSCSKIVDPDWRDIRLNLESWNLNFIEVR